MTFVPAPLLNRMIAGILLVLLTFAGGATVCAEEAKDSATVEPLLRKDLSGIPNKEVVVLTVEYLPGGASLPHRHNADVFVYVLEGSLIMQIEGHAPQTLGPGQTFYEGPGDIHSKSANASATQPAKFLVLLVKDKDKPVSQPVAANRGPRVAPVWASVAMTAGAPRQ